MLKKLYFLLAQFPHFNHTLNMVPSFTLMGESMWGNTRMGKSGTEHITTITGKKNTSW